MVFVLPTRAEVGVLDPEIAGEGQRVVLSDGEQVVWTPPPVKPVIPDISGIKSIRKYFGRQGVAVWPAWLYHPTKPARIAKDAFEAADLGVCHREATNEERSRYGVKTVWDYKDGSEWRPAPYRVEEFDPKNPGTGKTYVSGTAPAGLSNQALVEALIPQVAGAVAAALKSNGPSAPPAVDPKQWDAFLQFQAWQKSAEAVQDAVAAEEPGVVPPAREELSEGDAGEDRLVWEEAAKKVGVKPDGRWSLERLKAEVQKAA